MTVEAALNVKNPADDLLCDVVIEVIKTRKTKKISQKELAVKAGVSEQDIAYLETFAFERISYNVLWKVLVALDLKVKIES